MASPTEEAPWQPSSDAQALAQLRSLIRAYIRGELSHSAFVMQFGVQCLTHDMATPRVPDTMVACTRCGHQIYNPSCDCAHCTGDWSLRHYVPADVPGVPCEMPSAHDGSGDCGCPEIPED